MKNLIIVFVIQIFFVSIALSQSHWRENAPNIIDVTSNTDTLISKEYFLEQVKKKLNKHKPGQVIEFGIPMKFVDSNLALKSLQEIFAGTKPMPVAMFINLIEPYNCKLITYSYSEKRGLFRIGQPITKDWTTTVMDGDDSWMYSNIKKEKMRE